MNFTRNQIVTSTETICKDKEEWLEFRRNHITATEASVILGANPYKDPLTLWAEKTGRIEPFQGNEATMAGQLLEPVVAGWYQKETGEALYDPGEYAVYTSVACPLLSATPDRFLLSFEGQEEGVLEIKTAGAYSADDWADGPPLHYQIQVQQQLFCTRLNKGVIAVLIGGQKFQRYHVEKNPDFYEVLADECEKFWRDYIVADKQPPSASRNGIATLLKLHPKDDGSTVVLPSDFSLLDNELQQVKAEIKRLTEEKDEIEAKIKNAIGGATFGRIEGHPYQYTWKHQHKDSYTVKESDTRVLRRVKA